MYCLPSADLESSFPRSWHVGPRFREWLLTNFIIVDADLGNIRKSKIRGLSIPKRVTESNPVGNHPVLTNVSTTTPVRSVALVTSLGMASSLLTHCTSADVWYPAVNPGSGLT